MRVFGLEKGYFEGTTAPYPSSFPSPVFRTNETHRQHSIFGSEQLLPSKYRDRLRNSWGQTFRHEVFARIDETAFAVLYSEETSRPNAPVNVFVGAEILKAGFGWTDLQLADRMAFDLQVRHALGLDDLAMEVPELRTLYNWRRRVREHAETTGTNLFKQVCEQVTDDQLEAMKLKTEWQRVDSTQILSNLARLSRLELIISVVQKLWRALDEAARSPWKTLAEFYVSGRPYQVCYGIKHDEMDAHLSRLGSLLAQWAERHDLFAEAEAGLLERVLREQYTVGSADAACVGVRCGSEIPADSLQSPHDPEATYRFKSGRDYRGGYVANVSETCDPDNALQLITDVQLAPNSTDDAELLERCLDSQAERGISVEAVTTDGGYTGPAAEAACARHEVEHRATNMRGGESRSGKLGWERYEWHFDEHGAPSLVRCPHGKEAPLKSGRGDRFIARFPKGVCDGCPLLGNGCRVKHRARGTSFSLARRAIEVAVRRQRLRPEDKPVRAVVEATIRSVKHPFSGGKLSVRGLTRATMMVCASALMVNLRRIHHYRRKGGSCDWLFWLPRRLHTKTALLWQSIRPHRIGIANRVAMP